MNSARRHPPRSRRRAFTLVETLVATTILVIVLLAMSSMMLVASWSFDRTTMQTDADQTAVLAMQKLIVEIREAKEVTIPEPGRMQVIYPTVTAAGHYDRFQPDYANPVFYEQTDQYGFFSLSGTHLWRRVGNDPGAALMDDIKTFRAESDTPRSVRLTIEVERVNGPRTGLTKLEERVLYLRNN